MIARLAQVAEALGYDSLWTAEHIVLPDLPPGQHRYSADLPIVDSVALLGFLAAQTHTLRLGTGVLLLPQHHPVLLAKQLASLDVLSNGRLFVGVGVGSVEAEAQAMGVSMRDRGKRADEYLAAMQALWSQPHPSFAGQFVAFSGVNAYPRPQQRPGPPIVVGGLSDGALRRTVEFGSGWYGVRLDLTQTREALARLAAACERHGSRRPEGLGKIEISVLPSLRLTPDVVRQYAELGVDRLVLWPADASLADMETFLTDHAPARLGLQPMLAGNG
jgi:probable F420-dependent oxidoreductase